MKQEVVEEPLNPEMTLRLAAEEALDSDQRESIRLTLFISKGVTDA